MMDSLKELIIKNKEKFPEFEYYIPIIEIAERNQEEHPDIAIECCNSLVQGISKTIIFSILSSFITSISKLPKVDIKKLIKNESVHIQFSTALSILEKDIDDSVFFNLIENAFQSLQNKKPNNNEINKIGSIFREAIKISQEKRMDGEELQFLIACEKLIFDEKTLFFELIQNASFSLNQKPNSEDANFKQAIKLLYDHGDILEIDFIRACQTLINKISNFRNDRGDISHGREVPKLLKSDINLSRLIVEITESLLRYTLASFFILDLEKKAQEFEVTEVKEKEIIIGYGDNPEFNDFLDEEYPLDGKLLYSEALYNLYYEDYEIRLQAFLDEQAMLNEE
ncbi:hypothetical protein ACE1CI_19970 [Aerosakkonemataceae cyanobacterium BLCC-F50]|uniref:Abortive infection protein-like C-terminal domain-containing protein n=1 Tax=Floridaenema flaviceps BLCC-F50 TaxID=3153642 RepID=A0ABV4XU42_9CYAN